MENEVKLPRGTREMILTADDIVIKDEPCPEWGCIVTVRSLSSDEGTEWRRSMLEEVIVTDKNGKRSREMKFSQVLAERANLWMLSIACVDAETGARIFTSADVGALGKKSLHPITRLVRIIMDISGLSEKAA